MPDSGIADFSDEMPAHGPPDNRPARGCPKAHGHLPTPSHLHNFCQLSSEFYDVLHQKATTTVTTFELFVIKSVRSIFHTENDTLASVVSSRFD